MTPTLVTKDGKLVLLTGSPGGRTIINTVFTIVLGVTEYGLTGRQAVDLAHECITSGCPIARRSRKARCRREFSRRSRAMGHDVRAQGRQGDGHSIWIAPDGIAYGVPRQAHARLEGLRAAAV